MRFFFNSYFSIVMVLFVRETHLFRIIVPTVYATIADNEHMYINIWAIANILMWLFGYGIHGGLIPIWKRHFIYYSMYARIGVKLSLYSSPRTLWVTDYFFYNHDFMEVFSAVIVFPSTKLEFNNVRHINWNRILYYKRRPKNMRSFVTADYTNNNQ